MSVFDSNTVIQQFYKPKLFEVVPWTMRTWKKGTSRLFLYLVAKNIFNTEIQGLNNRVKQYVHIRNSMVESNLKNIEKVKRLKS